LAAIGHWHEVGIEAYPHKFHTTMRVPEFVEAYSSTVAIGETKEDVVVAVAGRVMSSRSQSAKLQFYDIHGEGSKVQIMYNMAAATKEEKPASHSSHPATGTLTGQAAYDWTVANIKRGDIVGEYIFVVGRIMITK
jgi:lysyl-tRNA synthetase, class II